MKKLTLLLMALVAVFAFSCKKEGAKKCECGDKCEEKCGKECKCEQACDEKCDENKECDKECDKECEKEAEVAEEVAVDDLAETALAMQKDFMEAFKNAETSEECTTLFNKYMDDMLKFVEENKEAMQENADMMTTEEFQQLNEEMAQISKEKAEKLGWIPDLEKSMEFAKKIQEMGLAQ